MGSADNGKLSEILDIVRSWIPWRTEHLNMSRDFWMPDHICRVCYECDSQFTLFNRKHHCRICGRVFCAKCTANSIPAPSDELKTGRDDVERIRVCNYCFKQWEQGSVAVDNGMTASIPGLSPSPSATSLVSTQSSCTNNSGSSVGSNSYSTGHFQHVPYSSVGSHYQNKQMNEDTVGKNQALHAGISDSVDARDHFSDKLDSCSRSDDEEEDYRVDSEPGHFSSDVYYSDQSYNDINQEYGPHMLHTGGERNEPCSILSSLENAEAYDSEVAKRYSEQADGLNNDVTGEVPPEYDRNDTDAEPLDFEKNSLLWHPPEPEDEEDEREALPLDDDEYSAEGCTGEWGYLQTSGSFGAGEHRNRDRSSEEHRKAMKNLLDSHFRALISQLLHIENLPVCEEDNKESWLDIITSLSWEAATLLKPDMSKSGGMDPGGYVKVKCVACGHRRESTVVKGVVCKKNVAHRRMTSKFDKPRFLILGGALEYQRVSNHLSSFDTLLQQEMDHLKMAVAKIHAHHPNVLLVEKSVSRFAQEYLLAKDISLVLNIKRPLLERIARCTGAQIVPSVDHLSTQKLGHCDSFHVDKFVEEHGSAGQGGKKLTKTLMFFEGCPRPLGCTILLKGANGDELKKVKHVVHYGIFAAYHLALETSFLADEGASLPELPLKSPIKVVLPDKPLSTDKSISTISGFTTSATEKQPCPQSSGSKYSHSNSSSFSGDTAPLFEIKSDVTNDCRANAQNLVSSVALLYPSRNDFSGQGVFSGYPAQEERHRDRVPCNESSGAISGLCSDNVREDGLINSSCNHETDGHSDGHLLHMDLPNSKPVSVEQDCPDQDNQVASSKQEYPHSASDHQSILVSLTTRCLWKGSVCERRIFRIKYYGSFDRPLGRFLRDHLFDQNYQCRSCELPPEAHIHCYTHLQGSLTISVRKLNEFHLSGEREGKIWMWHRCLRCPRVNGLPPSTRRVVMSDAAWGLSFGKFLELSFSNHVAASRVASCGHSLHRDCLRLYGFGNMVACFHYAPIHVHSVYLPPSKLLFNYDNQDWIQSEVDEVQRRTEILLAEVVKVLNHFAEKIGAEDEGKASRLSQQIAVLEAWLHMEKIKYAESFHQVTKGERKASEPAVDIFMINKWRLKLIFQSSIWDQLLIQLANTNNLQNTCSSIPIEMEKIVGFGDKSTEIPASSRPVKGFNSCDSFLLNVKPNVACVQYLPNQVDKQDHIDQDPSCLKDSGAYSSGTIVNHPNSADSSKTVRRVLSEGQFPVVENLSDTLDAAWSGKSNPVNTNSEKNAIESSDWGNTDASSGIGFKASQGMDSYGSDQDVDELAHCLSSSPSSKGTEKTNLSFSSSTKGTKNMENSLSRPLNPFVSLDRLFNSNSLASLKLDKIAEYSPAYILSFRDLLHQSGARLLRPIGIGNSSIVVPVYEDEPTSIISYALASLDYDSQLLDQTDKPKDGLGSFASLPILASMNLPSQSSADEATLESMKNLGSTDENILPLSISRSFSNLDSPLYATGVHIRMSFSDDGPLGKIKYTVTCYYAKKFEALRRTFCPSEFDFIRSLSRCKKWGAQGGKSNVFFAKTLDDRFIIKQVTKTELESFIKFASSYFKYLSESLSTGSPTCLAKILGIYQVTSKHAKGGKESKMDVLVMENLLYQRNIVRLYDLKGSSRSRYNSDSSGSNKVLLDQNLLETMPTSPIFVGTKAKQLLERAVWNDTLFLASIDVMDYSLLVGVDEEKHELVVGIIDFMRQYTWDKHLETWVKASGILGGSKNAAPTVISPMQYKKRFRKAMSAYFLMVPEQWPSSKNVANGSQSDLQEENN